MRVMVVGAGIAGLTAALQLARSGHQVTVLEKRPALRAGGYMIDFFGPGFDAAERLSLLPKLESIHYPIGHLRFVDPKGRTRADLVYRHVRHTTFHDRHFNVMRGDLERVLYDELPHGVRVRFSASPTSMLVADDHVTVATTDGTSSSYDLVIGADGVSSRVRELAFGQGEVWIRQLGCRTAAYIIENTLPELSGDAFTSLSGGGFTVGAYPIRDGRTATFFVYSSDAPIQDRSLGSCCDDLEHTFRGRGWILPRLLDGFPTNDVHYDDIVQVEMSRWSRGRVVLVGDACGCVSLLGGQGASMAVAGAHVLASEIAKHADLGAAIIRYETIVRPAVEERQRVGRRNRGWFVPASDLAASFRDRLIHLAIRTPLARALSRSLGASSLVAQ